MTKCTHSRVVDLRLAGNLVLTSHSLLMKSSSKRKSYSRAYQSVTHSDTTILAKNMLRQRRKARFRRATCKRHGDQINPLKSVFAQSSERKSRGFISWSETSHRSRQFHSRVVHHCYRPPAWLTIKHFALVLVAQSFGLIRAAWTTQRHDRQTNRDNKHKIDKQTDINKNKISSVTADVRNNCVANHYCTS